MSCCRSLHQLEIGVGGFRVDARIVGAIEELRVGHAGNYGDEGAMGLVERRERVAPVIRLWRGRRNRPIPFARLTGWSTAEPLAHFVLPGGDVEHDLLDRVTTGERTRRRLLMGDPGKDVDQRLAVPRLAGVLTLQLIDEPETSLSPLAICPHSSNSAPDPRPAPSP